jgi:integrase
VRYHIAYRLPNGRQRREFAGYSIEEARAAEGKRLAQKKENPGILEKAPSERLTFDELATWFLELPSVKRLASYRRVKQALGAFCREFGNRIVSSLKPADLEAYQEKRLEEGRAPATVDMELVLAKAMVTKAFDNDLVDGRTVKVFRTVKRKLRKAANARRRVFTVEEYLRLLDAAPSHLRTILTIAFETGMRLGEIRQLRWGQIDREKQVIRLEAGATKEGKEKLIPLTLRVRQVLAGLPRALHHDFVFTYLNEPIRSPGGIKKAFQSACRKAGIPCGRKEADGVVFHDIRRTVKTWMLSAGVDKAHRDLILGHSLQGMDAHYLSPSPEDLHRAMAQYVDWLVAQIATVDHSVDYVNHSP